MTEYEAFSIVTRDLRRTLHRMFRDSTPKLDRKTLDALDAICQTALKDIQARGYFRDFRVEVEVDSTDPRRLLINFTPPLDWIPVRFEDT